MLAVVILAGGQGRRIGGEKPLKVLAGQRLLDRAEHLASLWSNTRAVVVRATEQVEGTALTCVLDEPGLAGPLGGLLAGLRFADDAGCDAVLTIPADMPFLPEDLASRLNEKGVTAEAVLASSKARLHPVCALWPIRRTIDCFPDYLASGKRSLHGLAEVVGYTAVEWPVEPFDPFFNINSADDLAEAEQLLALNSQER